MKWALKVLIHKCPRQKPPEEIKEALRRALHWNQLEEK
jgi:hypothetical protein